MPKLSDVGTIERSTRRGRAPRRPPPRSRPSSRTGAQSRSGPSSASPVASTPKCELPRPDPAQPRTRAPRARAAAVAITISSKTDQPRHCNHVQAGGRGTRSRAARAAPAAAPSSGRARRRRSGRGERRASRSPIKPADDRREHRLLERGARKKVAGRRRARGGRCRGSSRGETCRRAPSTRSRSGHGLDPPGRRLPPWLI